MINVGNDDLSLLNQFRKVSNKEACSNFETRINEIKEIDFFGLCDGIVISAYEKIKKNGWKNI